MSNKTTERAVLKVTAADCFILPLNGTLSSMAENPLKTLLWARSFKIGIGRTHAYFYSAEDTYQGETSIFPIAIHSPVEDERVHAMNYRVRKTAPVFIKLMLGKPTERVILNFMFFHQSR